MDEISGKILDIVKKSDAPLETKEVILSIQQDLGDVSRSKVMYRLQNLRGDQEISGKSIGPGKGVWIWWSADSQG